MRIAFLALVLMALIMIADADAKYHFSGAAAERAVWIEVATAEVMWDLDHPASRKSHSKIDCSLAISPTARICRVAVRSEGDVVCRLKFIVKRHKHKSTVRTRHNTCY